MMWMLMLNVAFAIEFIAAFGVAYNESPTYTLSWVAVGCCCIWYDLLKRIIQRKL